MVVEAGAAFEAIFESGVSGQVGTVTVKLIDNDGTDVIAATTANITEDGVSGLYIWNAPAAPAALGQYSIVWSLDGTFTPEGGMGADELVVVPVGSSVLPPISPPDDGSLTSGPCSQWTTTAEVAACCNADTTVNPALLTESITVASQVLYEASGRRFAGICQRTVRPCQTDACACGYQILSRGHLVGWDDSCWDGYNCGCQAVSRVKLAGYVRSIQEVKIDGVVVDPSAYRVDENRWLVRVDGSRWPSCQSMDVADTEPGSFAVTYNYGRIPPTSAQQAARQLACEIYKSCTGANECALPTGVTRVTRQGLTFERSFFQRDANGIWRTGLGLVDLYLNSTNPHGLRRRAVFWSPLRRARYARGAG